MVDLARLLEHGRARSEARRPLQFPARRLKPRSTLLALGALLAFVAALAPTTWAGRPVPIFEATVRGGDQAAAVEDAMREVLVRATGRKDAGSDPAFAPLVMHAAQYVRATRPAGDGLLAVSFDDAAVARDIVAAGRGIWDADRPFTLVVLSPAPTGAADDETRRELEQAAERRGLPVSLVPMPVSDQSGNLHTADVLLTDARRLGGDAVLLGRSDASAPNGTWQWTLITGLTTRGWDGPLDAGIDGAADALASVGGSALPLADGEAVVRVSGVGTLADYAAVERTLGELPGLRRSGIEETDGATATFRVLIRGGAQAIEHALAGSQHFTRLEGAISPEPGGGEAPAPLAYEYHP
jgi:hypothetical protein